MADDRQRRWRRWWSRWRRRHRGGGEALLRLWLCDTPAADGNPRRLRKAKDAMIEIPQTQEPDEQALVSGVRRPPLAAAPCVMAGDETACRTRRQPPAQESAPAAELVAPTAVASLADDASSWSDDEQELAALASRFVPVEGLERPSSATPSDKRRTRSITHLTQTLVLELSVLRSESVFLNEGTEGGAYV